METEILVCRPTVRVPSQHDLHAFLHAATIKSLFDGKVKFSEDGSNMKAKEMATYMFFTDYLEDCAGLYCVYLLHMCNGIDIYVHVAG